MLADDYNCDKCRGLCKEFVKIRGNGKDTSFFKCRYSGCNFTLTAYPALRQVYRLDLLYNLPDVLNNIPVHIHIPNIEGVINYLLSWDKLQLEDAIRLAKVNKYSLHNQTFQEQKAIGDFYNQLLNSQEALGTEFEKVMPIDFFDLYEAS